ncbi:MAG: YbaK/EbsC family protein [Oscillospiraceae bacterium]|nr:YbaK/EbsC family protein [Oscillospiraceae bacterium]
MSVEKARAALAAAGFPGEVYEHPESSATVELAAACLGCEPARIAKTLSFLKADGSAILIVAAGDAKVENRRYKETFGEKAKMIPGELVEELVGHAPGGVCPFGVNPGVKTYLDESLKRFVTVYPAGGSSNSSVEMTLPQLEEFSLCEGWVDVCKGWREEG